MTRILTIVDRFIVTRFLPPFVASFFIALFVLIMQFLWKNIKHLAGKGVDGWTILEILSYLSISMMPMALPIAVLLSSVLVFGGMAERFELPGLKSAGVSFIRLSLSAMIFCFCVSLFSFLLSNNIIPVTNLKFHSRMYDIKHSKPTLNLEEKVFNQDFQNYVIYVGEKGKDNETIRDLIIYDKERSGLNEYYSLTAKNGRMHVSDDEKYFMMELYDGHRYEEVAAHQSQGSKYPFTVASFKKWSKAFDLSEFNAKKTDENLFSHHRYMLTTGQIMEDTDTLRAKDQRMMERLYPDFGKKPEDVKNPAHIREKSIVSNQLDLPKNETRNNSKELLDQDLDSLDQGFLYTFAQDKRRPIAFKAKAIAQKTLNQLQASSPKHKRNLEEIAKNIFEVHNKFAYAAMCMIFLLIGGPMGAIVRKGGYGVSLLIAIIFFVFYIMTNIFFRKMCYQLAMDPILAAWLPPGILMAVGILLTVRASNDSKLIDVAALWRRKFGAKETAS